MNRGWYHHSMAHKLASKGIKSKSPFERVFANGLIEVEPVWWDDLPDTLYRHILFLFKYKRRGSGGLLHCLRNHLQA